MKSSNAIAFVAALAGSVSFAAAPAAAEGFQFIAGQVPPYAVAEDGVLVGGVHVDTLVEIASRVGLSADVELMPWARAYNQMLNEDDHVIAMMMRSAPREDLFAWIIPVLPERMVLWTWGGESISAAEASGLGSIGVQLDTPMQNWAEAQGWTNIEVVSDPNTLARLLAGGRVDAIVNLESLARFSAIQEGLDPNQLVAGEEIFASHVYIAGSQNLIGQDFSDWEAAFEEMKADGTYAEILGRYGLEPAAD